MCLPPRPKFFYTHTNMATGRRGAKKLKACCFVNFTCVCLQGAGKLSVVNSKTILERYIPRASLVPRKLDFTGGMATGKHLLASARRPAPLRLLLSEAAAGPVPGLVDQSLTPALTPAGPLPTRTLPRRLSVHVALLPAVAVCREHAPHVQRHHLERAGPDWQAGGRA